MNGSNDGLIGRKQRSWEWLSWWVTYMYVNIEKMWKLSFNYQIIIDFEYYVYIDSLRTKK
jgi:hypothetical protein